jgi:hypothetical protein
MLELIHGACTVCAALSVAGVAITLGSLLVPALIVGGAIALGGELG